MGTSVHMTVQIEYVTVGIVKEVYIVTFLFIFNTLKALFEKSH